ncbi:hypothetical protein BC332_29765 [Capsicum chinense]|nr:hypothetical protein BC332_29765 [Capsicum chinense]
MGNFFNDQDALQMTILFFIRTFLFYETDDATVSYIEFNMVEDGRYEQYPWGKISFNKLLSSLRKDFFVEKKLYRLGGMPHVLNVWMYECCSEVDKDIACRIGNGIPRICNWFVVGTKPKFEKFMNGMFSKYAYTNISPTVDELKCLQLPNHDGMDLKDSVSSTLQSTSCRQPIKVDHKCKMSAGSLLLDDFDDFTTQPPLVLLNRTKAKSDITLAPPSKRRKTNTEQKESMTDQEKIEGYTSVKEVNKEPSGTSNTITDPINEEAPHKPSLMDFDEQTPTAEQNPLAVESVCESTQKINVSRGTYHEKILMKVDMNAIESLVKTFVDKRFDDIEALMKKHHEEMKKQHEEMICGKNEPHDDDLGTSKEHPTDVPEMNDDENDVYTGDHKQDENPSNESSYKFNFDDPDFRRQTIEVQNVQNESETEVKNVAFQHSINNTMDDFSSPESTNTISTDSSQESIDNIIAGIFTPVIAMKMKSASPTEMNDNECQIHDTRFQSDLPEVELGKQDAIKTRAPRNKKRTTIFRSPFTTEFGSSCKGKESATVDFPRKHPFDGYLISDEMPMGLIEEYCDWIVEGLLKFHEKNSLDFVVVQPDSKNWFYTMSQPNTCWNDEHVDVIFYYLRKKSKQQKNQEYRYTTVNCLFKTYIDATYKRYIEDAAGDSLSTQDDYKKMSFVASYEGALINIIKGFNIPAALSWHLVDEVYIPVNCDENFHWVLAVISLKKRCIRVYDSMLSSQPREPSHEIKRLSVMLPTYIRCSGLLENTERTVWSSLEAYKDKISKVAGDLNDTPFDVEYVEDIAQQVSGSLDCGILVEAYAEFLSDQIQISSSNLDAEYLRRRYATFLWNYGVKKAKKIYSSDHDDPPRVRSFYVPPTDTSNILAIE